MYVILFVILTIGFGIISREINKKFGIPYTPLLIICGGIVGGFDFWGYFIILYYIILFYMNILIN
jgi:hypothetical protein